MSSAEVASSGTEAGVSVSEKTVRYNYRLRVSDRSKRLLGEEWDAKRWVWNRCVEISREAHRRSTPEKKVTCGPAELDRMLTRWRAEHDWLGAKSSVVQQQTIRDFCKARSKALKDISNRLPQSQRRGMPRFKSKKWEQPSLSYTLRGFTLKDDADGRVRLRLAGGIVVRPVWSRPLPSPPTSVNVYRDACGAWWCSFVVKIRPQPLPTTGKYLGIDWGVKETATTTDDDYDLPHPEYGKKTQKRLAKAQRRMARRKPAKGRGGSKGYKEAKTQAAKAYRKVARQRQDTRRKWAKRVVRDHDGIAAENFQPKFLAKTTMARKAADGAIAATKNELSFMAWKHLRDLRLIPPAGTTMECSDCGAIAKHRLELSERIYTCEACGVVKPRDKNSAQVILKRAGFNPVAPTDVRPEPSQRTRAA